MKRLPFSQACENNKDPILRIIRQYLRGEQVVLEIGAGTGQHAVHFAENLPDLLWQSSDIEANLPWLQARIEQAELPNLLPPVLIDVTQEAWGIESVDSIYSANSLHIMPRESVDHFFEHAGQLMLPDGHLIIYGPFKYEGQFATKSNYNFDLWLKTQNPYSGIRDFEYVNELAGNAGFSLIGDHPMPANNQLLVWQKADN